MFDIETKYAALQALKICRASLAQDFTDQNPEIFAASYKYEDSPAMLTVAMDKYFISWLSSHWLVFQEFSLQFAEQERQHVEKVFAEVFLSLLQKWSLVNSNNKTKHDFGLKLISEMQTALTKFAKAGENSNMMKNRLEVALEKNRVIFNRSIRNLGREDI
jgi:hypothetical protein